MALTKLLYETPASELLEVRMERCFVYVRSANYSDVNGGVSGDDYYEDYDL